LADKRLRRPACLISSFMFFVIRRTTFDLFDLQTSVRELLVFVHADEANVSFRWAVTFCKLTSSDVVSVNRIACLTSGKIDLNFMPLTGSHLLGVLLVMVCFGRVLKHLSSKFEGLEAFSVSFKSPSQSVAISFIKAVFVKRKSSNELNMARLVGFGFVSDYSIFVL